MFSMTSRNIPFLEMRFERLPYLDTSHLLNVKHTVFLL